MKKALFTSMAVAVAHMASFAQPTITKAQNFAVGQSVKIQNCAPATPGAAGASQVWNFESLAAISDDTIHIDYLAAPAGNLFGANVVAKGSDSTYMYYNQTSAATYIAGVVDSTVSGNNINVGYPNTALQMKRPLTYNMSVTDTFTDHSISSAFDIKGAGTGKLKADAWGTLSLPNGTYSNVIRVRTEVVENDTLTGASTLTYINTRISYSWYDNAHAYPLLTIDSIINPGGTDIKVVYLLSEKSPLGVASSTAQNIQVSGTFYNSTLQLNANFRPNQQYFVDVYNMAGLAVFQSSFSTADNKVMLCINSDMPPGIYIVKLQEYGCNSTPALIKILKQ